METQKSTLCAGGGTGTLAFMPPEAFNSEFSDKSDMFSFAVLTFEVLPLKVPQAGKSTAEITKLAIECCTVSKALEKRCVTADEQEQEWLEESSFKDRCPNLSLVTPGCPPSLRHPRRCKTSSVCQSAGLSIPRSSVRFRQKLKKPKTQIYMDLRYIDPRARVSNYCLKK